MRKYGNLNLKYGKSDGYSLEDIKELAEECNKQECDISDLTMDLAIIPAVLLDMVKHIKELESQLDNLNNNIVKVPM